MNQESAGTPTSIALVGAGAIGTAVASRLDPTKTSLTAFRRDTVRPLRLELPDGRRETLRAGYLRPDDARPVDWVFLATKAQQLPSVGPLLTRLISEHTRVVVLQNGIRHAERVSQWVPAERVIPSAIFSVASWSGEDLVRVHDFGEILVPQSEAAAQLVALFQIPPIVRMDAEFQQTTWQKLILNAAFNSITALAMQPASFREVPVARRLLQQVFAEGISVAEASGVAMRADELDRLMAVVERIPAEASSSMKLDRERARTMEFDFITGGLVREAETAGVEVPALNVLHGLLIAAGHGSAVAT